MVSVIIPHLRGQRLLAACLDSVAAQSQTPVEVILVDNGSTDGSAAVFRDHPARPLILRMNSNIGFSRAINAGIDVSSAELLLILNDDATLAPDCVERLVTTARKHDSYGSFAPRIESEGSPDAAYATGLMYSHRGYGNRSQRFQLTSAATETDVFGFCGAAALLRRKALRDVGGFNESFFVLHEDVELSFRLQLGGYPCKYVPSAIVRHEGSATLRSFTSIVVRETVKNSILTVATCAPSDYLRQNWRAIAHFHLTLWRSLLEGGYGVQVFRALCWLLFRLLAIYARRRRLQSESVIGFNALDALLYRGPVLLNLPGGVLKIK